MTDNHHEDSRTAGLTLSELDESMVGKLMHHSVYEIMQHKKKSASELAFDLANSRGSDDIEFFDDSLGAIELTLQNGLSRDRGDNIFAYTEKDVALKKSMLLLKFVRCAARNHKYFVPGGGFISRRHIVACDKVLIEQDRIRTPGSIEIVVKMMEAIGFKVAYNADKKIHIEW